MRKLKNMFICFFFPLVLGQQFIDFQNIISFAYVQVHLKVLLNLIKILSNLIFTILFPGNFTPC